MMLDVLNELQSRLAIALVPGSIGAVYLGIVGEERQALISDYDILCIGPKGEDTISETTSSTEGRMYHVQMQLLVRAPDTGTAVANVLTKWQALENFLFTEANKRITVAGVIYTESLGGFFAVQDQVIGDGSVPLWRFREATVDYRVALYRGGRHPY
jgi:hypothetical protein